MNELSEFIRTATATEIRETLDFLLNECSLDQAPTRENVVNWREILQQRGGKFTTLATLCTQFLEETA